MKQKAIALILSAALALSSIGTAPILAAETTAQEAAPVEETTPEEAEDNSEEEITETVEEDSTQEENTEIVEEEPAQEETTEIVEEEPAQEETTETVVEESDESSGSENTEKTVEEEQTQEEASDGHSGTITAPGTTEKDSTDAVMSQVASGTCGTNVTWTLDEEGTLTISGTGEMSDYYRPWSSYTIHSILIEDGVTSIGAQVFWGCSMTSVSIPNSVKRIKEGAFISSSELIRVTIPNGVEDIGKSAFKGCTSLTGITIPSSVISIGSRAFENCSSLTSITIPDGVTSIQDYVFKECSSLTSITIPDSITSIGDWAFTDCSSLTSVTIPKNVTNIGEKAFYGCSKLTRVTIMEGVTKIGDEIFRDCSSLTSVTIPGSVTNISELAFCGCRKLSSVTIMEGVTSIGPEAFGNCSSLTEVTIPNSIISIGYSVFDTCTSLNNIIVESGNLNYSSINGVLFDKAHKTLIFCPRGKRGDYSIPNGVTNIEKEAFAACWKLTSVTIPDSVTNIGLGAFYNCKLTSVTIPNSVTSIEGYTFSVCGDLINVTIPDSVTSIGDSAFSSCWSLKSVVIPEGVTNIGKSAFSYSGSLSTIYFYGNAPSTSSDAFTNVTATAYYPANDPTWTEDVRQNYGGTITWVPWIAGSGVITIHYNSISSSHSFYYDDLFFYSDNNDYNNALAILTLGMELASFSSIEEERYTEEIPKESDGYTVRAKNIRETYETLGFANTKYYNYGTPLSDPSDKVAYSFARKIITNGTSTDTLVVIPIRGGGYGAEWASNFRVGASGNSYGFNEASKKVLADLKSYLQSIEIQGNLKLWITGHSRAGATANLLTHYINKEANSGTFGVPLNTGDIYTYAFATPNCYDSSIGDSAAIDNDIFNIISANDLVPKIPLAHWGYQKYGQVKVLPEYSIKNVSSEFEEMTGKKLEVNKLASLWNGISDSLFIVVQDSVTYYHDYQQKVSGIFRDEFSQPGGNLSSAFLNMLKTMVGTNPVCSLIAAGYAGGTYIQSGAEGLSGMENMHYMEHYLSWLEFGNSEFATLYSKMPNDERITYNQILDSTFNNNYKRYRIFCPVDVKVYSNDGELLISIIDNEIVVDALPCSVCGEEKSFYLLGDISNYHIELTGNDTGSMSYFVDEYNNQSEVVRSVYYYDIPLEEDIVYQADVSTVIEDVHEDYSVTNGDMTTEKSLDTLTDPSETFSVDVENGGSDKAFAMVGEAVMLYADINEDQELVRWESDDENVLFDNDTSPSTFIRMPSNNIKVRAIIRQKEPDGALTDLCGENVYWSLNDAGILTISGSGLMTDFPDMSSTPWHGMEVKKVVIDEGITSIGTCAFCDLDMTSVILPKSMEKIGNYAFEECHSLSDVTLPDGLLELGKASFAGTNIQKIEIPDTVSSIGENTFTNCNNLEQATIKAPVNKISNGTFSGCSSLKTVHLPNTINRIEKFAFLNCTSLTDIYFYGSENKWNDVIIEKGLDSDTCIENAKVHFVEENETITIDESNVSIEVNDQVWTGKPITPVAVVKCFDEVLAKDTDFVLSYTNNTNVGKATITITGVGNYEGAVTKTFKINPASISSAAVTGLTVKTYTGKALTQSPVVKNGSITLKAGTDYTVSYKNNTNAGTATVTFTGKGNYTGTKTATFKINKAAQNIAVKASVASIAVGKTATVSITGAKGTKSYKSSNTAIATVNASTGVVTGKKAGTVTITATSAETANYNVASETVKITVTASKTLKKPGNCHFTKWNNSKYTGCRISWNKVDGAEGYQTLLSWTDGSHSSATIVKSNVLYRDCTVHPQHVSQMKVRAFYTLNGQRKYGPWSNVEYITPSPAKLTTKKASSGSNLKMNISWNIIYGCNGYNVFITTNPNGKWYWNQSTTEKATATSASIDKCGGAKLKKNTRYYVRIVTRRKRNGVFCTVPMPANNTYIGSFVIK